MQKILFIFLLNFCFLIVNAQSKQKAIFIIADGIPADVIEKVNTPTLHAIAKEGALLRAHVGGEKGGYSQTPTISANGYNCLLTGTWVNKHNVWGNDIKDPNYHYYSIFRILKEQKAESKIAVFSSWLDNRTKLVGDGLAETGIKVDYHADGYEHDTIRFKHDKADDFMHLIDEEVTTQAVKHIREVAPDLSWIYLEYTDDMGHAFGDSEKFYKAVEMMDSQVRRVWDAIQYRKKNFGEDWVIFITTDHGRDAQTGQNHGGQTDRERNTWIVTSAKNINPYFQKNQAAIVDILPSVARHLQINIPKEQAFEIDGVPLIGKLSVVDLKANYEQGKIRLEWRALDKAAKLKIWLSTTNNFKTGGKDEYKLMLSADASKESAVLDISKMPSKFYKVVVEAPDNILNRWVMVGNGQ